MKNRITGISIGISAIIGFCFWLFITRCDDKSCLFHYVPAAEIFISVFAGWTLPVAFLNLKTK
jgi:hypothetical protein